MSVFLKDPSAVLDYEHDWSDYLAAGESIATSTWTITPTTLSPLTQDSEAETADTATIWLSGGLLGKVYRVTNHIVTSSARTDDRTIVVRIENV